MNQGIDKRLKKMNLPSKRFLNMIFQLALFDDYKFTFGDREALRQTYKHLEAGKLKGAKLAASKAEISLKLFSVVSSEESQGEKK